MREFVHHDVELVPAWIRHTNSDSRTVTISECIPGNGRPLRLVQHLYFNI